MLSDMQLPSWGHFVAAYIIHFASVSQYGWAKFKHPHTFIYTNGEIEIGKKGTFKCSTTVFEI